uniref:Uncharacterized protein n=1 Tax=Anguilla anguilla TaxID=7936 RepID=A0A0E9W276_ANGAN
MFCIVTRTKTAAELARSWRKLFSANLDLRRERVTNSICVGRVEQSACVLRATESA